MVRKNISAGKLPFSKAIIHDFKYSIEVSGQVGLDSSGKLVDGIEKQTHQTLTNLKNVLEEVGCGFEDVIKVRIYLTDMKDYAIMNEIYSKYFSKDYPTRVALAVNALPLGALIEIECTAAKNE